MQGSFWVDWEVRGGKACGFALVWWMGGVYRLCLTQVPRFRLPFLN